MSSIFAAKHFHCFFPKTRDTFDIVGGRVVHAIYFACMVSGKEDFQAKPCLSIFVRGARVLEHGIGPFPRLVFVYLWVI